MHKKSLDLRAVLLFEPKRAETLWLYRFLLGYPYDLRLCFFGIEQRYSIRFKADLLEEQL